MDYEFDPIILRYQGLDAERHVIDLGQLGQSIQGASQLLGSAGHLVVTGQYAKRSHALSVRVLAGTARESSWELPAILMSIAPAILPVFPTIAEIGKKAATTATTRIVNYALKKLAGNKSEAEMAFGLVEKAMAEVGQTSRHAMDVVERIATNNRPAARLFVVPIGESCTHVCLGETVDGAEPIDKAMRDAIEAPEPVEISPSGTYRVLISEIDLINRSCKFTI